MRVTDEELLDSTDCDDMDTSDKYGVLRLNLPENENMDLPELPPSMAMLAPPTSLSTPTETISASENLRLSEGKSQKVNAAIASTSTGATRSVPMGPVPLVPLDEATNGPNEAEGEPSTGTVDYRAPSQPTTFASQQLANNNIQLLSQMTRFFEEKFEAMEQKFSTETESTSEKLYKKLRKEPYEFKKKSNRVQWELNTEMSDRMHSAKTQLQKRPPQIRRAVDTLQEGISDIAERNKYILMADKSEAGWATVNEYIQRDIAADSDDDRRIRKAESAALKKLEQKKKKSSRRHHHYQYTATSFNPNHNFRGQSGDYRSSSYTFRPYDHTNKNQAPPPSICFGCHQPGHQRRNCPNTKPSGQGSQGSGSTSRN